MNRAIDATNSLVASMPGLLSNVGDLQKTSPSDFVATSSDIDAVSYLIAVLMHELGEIRDRNCTSKR